MNAVHNLESALWSAVWSAHVERAGPVQIDPFVVITLERAGAVQIDPGGLLLCDRGPSDHLAARQQRLLQQGSGVRLPGTYGRVFLLKSCLLYTSPSPRD